MKNAIVMKKPNYKTWSIILFVLFIGLFFLLAFNKNTTTTWIWQLSLPLLLIIQIFVVLKARDETKKTFDDEWYDHK